VWLAGSGKTPEKAKSLVVCLGKRLLKRVVALKQSDFAAFHFFGSGRLLTGSFFRNLLGLFNLTRVAAVRVVAREHGQDSQRQDGGEESSPRTDDARRKDYAAAISALPQS
jgi:hypothetical protein